MLSSSATRADTVPLGRYGQMRELQNLIIFLLSDACDYLTGQTIAIDGGQHLAGPATFADLTALTDDQWRAAREAIERTTQRDKAQRAAGASREPTDDRTLPVHRRARDLAGVGPPLRRGGDRPAPRAMGGGGHRSPTALAEGRSAGPALLHRAGRIWRARPGLSVRRRRVRGALAGRRKRARFSHPYRSRGDLHPCLSAPKSRSANGCRKWSGARRSVRSA